jgi:uncharacterized membrane protein AbrB (regulator of aidB expression)
MLSSWIESTLVGSMDLSDALVTEPSSGLLIVTSRMTSGRLAMTLISAGVCLGFLSHAWIHRRQWWDIVWPHPIMIFVFGILAIHMGFGFQQKTLDRSQHELTLSPAWGH